MVSELGGFIGGGQGYETIRHAGLHMLDLARHDQARMHPTSEFPLPEDGQIVFYAVTDSGVFTTGASERQFGVRA